MERPLTHDSTRSASSSSRKIELPWLILAALLLSTLLAAFQSSRQLRADADARFEEISQREKRSLLRQLRDVENLLQGAKAFATTLPNLSQATWSTYVGTRMRDSAMYPGVIAIQLIPNAGSISVSLTWTNLPVPTLSGNLALWRTSPALVDAINKAALTNALVMSQSLPIMEGIPTPSSFVALALPLNSGGTGAALTSVQSTGTVLAIVNLAALVSAMERNPVYPVIRELFDGEKRLFPPLDPSPEEVSNAELSVNLPVTFGGRTFQLKISSTPQLEKQLRSDLPRTILIIGIFGTMLLGALV